VQQGTFCLQDKSNPKSSLQQPANKASSFANPPKFLFLRGSGWLLWDVHIVWFVLGSNCKHKFLKKQGVQLLSFGIANDSSILCVAKQCITLYVEWF
jgi:hypothetical protein